MLEYILIQMSSRLRIVTRVEVSYILSYAAPVFTLMPPQQLGNRSLTCVLSQIGGVLVLLHMHALSEPESESGERKRKGGRER